jgi:hypothetical protein
LVGVPFLLGSVFDRFGAGWALFPLAAALAVLAVLTWALVPETRVKRVAENGTPQ